MNLKKAIEDWIIKQAERDAGIICDDKNKHIFLAGVRYTINSMPLIKKEVKGDNNES